MALGWPVRLKGPAPGRPIWPVARCRLISAAFLSVPLALWFRPWQYRLRVAGLSPNQRAAVRRSASLRPVRRAVSAGEGAHPLGQGLEAGGVGGDVGGIGQALGQQQVQQAVVQRHVAAGLEGQVQVGQGGRLGAARVGHDPLLLRAGAAGVFEPAHQDGVGPGQVAAGDEDRVGVGEVLVAAGRRIGPSVAL
jgi:hypothetical protein